MERTELMANGLVRIVSRVVHRGPIDPAHAFQLVPAPRAGFRRTAVCAGRNPAGTATAIKVIDEQFPFRS